MNGLNKGFLRKVIKMMCQTSETCIPKGWCHIYLDFGNHLTVKKEFYRAVREIFKDKDNCDIIPSLTVEK